MSHHKLTNNETVLIVNPNSGGGATGKNWESLYNQIKKILGENPEVVFSQTSEDGTSLTRDFLRKGFRKIIAIGGDGTINEIANGFFEEITSENSEAMPVLKPINAEAILGILPSGSRNVLAKSLNLPEGIAESCQRFVSAKPQNIDVIAARVTTTPPSVSVKDQSMTTVRLFLNAAETGVGAEIIDRSKKIRGKVKSRLISTISSVIATLPTYGSNLCKISIDDGRESLLLKMTMGIVANGTYLGGGFKGAPHASISDGLLDITIIKDSGSLKMLDELVIMKNDVVGSKPDNDISYLQAKKVEIESKERDITVAIDGEPIGILPATFQVYRNALSVKF